MPDFKPWCSSVLSRQSKSPSQTQDEGIQWFKSQRNRLGPHGFSVDVCDFSFTGDILPQISKNEQI